MNDGIVFEQGSKPNRVRAVVMRHGIRIVSDWRRSRDAALRHLVLKLVKELANAQMVREIDFEDEIPSANSVSRLEFADLVEQLATAKFLNIQNAMTESARLTHLNGKEIIYRPLDALFRGAWTLRWVHKRETSLP